MAGSFLSNFSFMLVINLLVKLFWVFGIEVAVQNYLGTAAYGAYFSSFQFSYLFFILLDMGISNYNNKIIAQDESLLRKYFPNIFILKLLLAAGYLLLLLVATWIAGYDATKRGVILFVGINQVIVSLMVYLRSNVSALHLFKTDSLLSVLDRLIMGIFCAFLLWLPFFRPYFDLYLFIGAQTIAYFLAACIGFAVVMHQLKHLQWKPDWPFLKGLLRKAYPYAVLITLMSMYTRIDGVMLERMLPEGDFHAGIYASAFRLMDAAAMFSVLLAGILLPMFSRLIAQEKPVNGLVKESFLLLMVPVMVLPLSCFFYSTELYSAIYDANHTYGSRVFAFLMLNFVPLSMGYIFGTLLTAKGDLKLLNIISAIGLVINVLLNLVLIPQYQALGATYATLITQGVVMIATIWRCNTLFGFFSFGHNFWRVFAFVFLSVLIFIALKNVAFHWMVQLVASVILVLVLAILLKIVQPAQAVRSLRQG